MPKLEKLDSEVIQGISDVLGHRDEGLSNKEISKKLADLDIQEIGGSNKVEKLYNALSERQRRDDCSNLIVKFLNSAMHAANYHSNLPLFEQRQEKLNKVLASAGYRVRDDGKLGPATIANTVKEAHSRANKLRQKLEERNVHSDVLKSCQDEFLKDQNYFHTVLEASKSVRDKIRDKTGVDLDGSALVDAVMMAGSKGVPLLAINKFQTASEKNEQTGFANMIKGMFSAFRNPTAHESRSQWNMPEEDALDFLVFASMLHRKLDRAAKTQP